ncbi:MAG: PH domain-containing protein [Elusimicrobiota bacterium]
MAPAELKLLVLSPSIKNWPVVFVCAALVFLTGALGLVLLFLPLQATVLLCAFGMALLVWPALHAGNTEYWVTNLRVAVRGGVFCKSESEVSLQDIQEIRIMRSPLQKILGVGNVDFIHAGGALSFAGIEEPEKLRDKVLTLT